MIRFDREESFTMTGPSTGVGKRAALATIAACFTIAMLTTAPRAGADPSGHGFAYCYANLPGATGYVENQATYFTAIYPFARGGVSPGFFTEYVEKKYSLRSAGPAGCSYGSSQAGVETSFKQRLAQLRSSGQTVIETDWTDEKHAALMADVKNNPPPTPVAPSKPQTAPPSDAQTAYEKAMAAQRPALNTAPGSAAASSVPAAAPAGVESEKYSFCYVVGSQAGPSAGASRPNYYVTGVFESSGTVQPQRAFSQMVRANHPREALGGTVCSTPQPMNATEIARTNRLNKEKAQYNVVELNWKPE